MSRTTQKEQTRLFNHPNTDTQMSKFDLSYRNKISANFNKMIPTCVKALMPKDKVSMKTEFYSRFLTMLAPTFNSYAVKFNQFFVPYSQLWGGWTQFMGMGDDASAEYLLGHEQRPNIKVPYFTTKRMAELMFSFLFDQVSQFNAGDLVRPWSLGRLRLSKMFRKDYSLVVGWTCSHYVAGRQNSQMEDTSGDPATIRGINGRRVNIIPIMFIARKGTTLDAFLRSGLLLEYNPNLTAIEMGELLYQMRERRVALYYQNYNIDSLDAVRMPSGQSEDYTNADFSKWAYEPISEEWIFPVMSDFLGRMSRSTDVVEWQDSIRFINGFIEGAGKDLDNEPASVFFDSTMWYKESVDIHVGLPCTLGYYVTNWNSEADDHEVKLMSDNVSGTKVNSRYIPCGFSFQYSTDEIHDAFGGTGGKSVMQWWLMTYGQWFISHIFGSGTLTDYLGINLTQQLYRQNDELTQIIYKYGWTPKTNVAYDYNVDAGGYHKSRVGIGARDALNFEDAQGSYYTFGGYTIGAKSMPRYKTASYHKETAIIEVGVINDEPINVLPYLAYKKYWTELIRDPRFSLRDEFCDPYTSPFLIPLPNEGGQFIQGDILSGSTDSLTGPYLTYSEQFSSAQNGQRAQARSMFFHDTIFDFFKLKDRRISKDVFSLITPNNQYGDEVLATETYTPAQGSGISINALRYASKLQRFMERNNIVGSDYVKQMLIHFGNKPKSCEHCEIKYLGGDKFDVNISGVEMTAQSTQEQQTGQSAGVAQCSGTAGKCSFDVDEHGIFMQIMCIQNDYEYSTYLDKTWSATDLYDFAFPEFANLPPEEVSLSQLVNTDGTRMYDSSVGDYVDFDPRSRFGYAPRYWNHKCSFDQIHGDFKKSLSYWVSPRQIEPSLLGGAFGFGVPGNKPSASASMQYESPNYEAFTYTGEDYAHMLIDMKQFIQVVRCLPTLPTPTLS